MKECFRCKKNLPLFLFSKRGAGYKEGTPLYACKFCSFKQTTRYERVPGKLMDKLEPYETDIIYRIKEFFNIRR